MTPETAAAIHAAAFADGRPWTASEIADLIASPNTYLTAQDAAGFALWRAVAGEAELLAIAVSPDRQGHGIGAALMQDWMQAARALADTAFLEVAHDNVRACALYARCGFVEVARRTGYYARPQGRADALVLRAALRAVPS
ncbi:ribosomal protein S18-alanine N-acetyltransferase [uncultured Tateyamaria sp.]|uniref:ribosomal protein S18-alanine N-acetyltransferase n=1 Tax=uncultured Tateyamaria sp. TaxID=455651 RepID=UPI0026348EB7|nr:ribosomal protein S18-alanine N-acetyltransferase [uncultured Tateyamaria sp.]